eukprot:m.202969 g.202969  ORF g.202969 m.202969 type:complete len:741 (-) comp17730_c1_seq1:293-2515(-)
MSTATRPGFVPQPARTAKKIIVKNFAAPTTPGHEFFEENWRELETAIKAIHQQQQSEATNEQLLKRVSDLCAQKMTAQLHQRLTTLLEVQLRGVSARLNDAIAASASTSNNNVVQQIDAMWTVHCSHTKLIRHIFLFLDCSTLQENSNLEPIWTLGLRLFKQYVLLPRDVLSRLTQGQIELVEHERGGETIDRTVLKSSLRMLAALDLYATSFEAPFLARSEAYFTAESQRLLHEMEVPLYLAHVKRRLDEERDRLDAFLDETTARPLMAVLDRTLLKAHFTQILEKGATDLFDNNRLDDIRLLSTFAKRIEANVQLKNCFSEYVKKRGLEIVMVPEKDKTMIDDLLAFKQRLDVIVEKPFGRDEVFVNCLKDTFESFINQRHNKPAELLARYIDGKMRTGYKESSEDELETLLDKCMIIFRFINGKDVFEAFYKAHLAKRLLLQRSSSIDLERSVLFKLKQECGSGFTSKLEGMFKDISMAEDSAQLFRKHCKTQNITSTIEMSVHVLTASNWPTYPPTPINLPPDMVSLQEAFRNFYCGRHANRRLAWQSSLGHCMVDANFPEGEKELQVSLFQTVVLLLFNERNTISFKEIREATNIEKDELIRTMQSLSLGKVRVLLKTNKGKDVEEDDKFCVNKKFSNPHKRVKINQIQLKETEAETEATSDKVFQDRAFAVDAAIVRIMKTRKTLSHNILISELFGQLKFPVKPADLKKRIESLIDREYMERVPNDSQAYNYLA